MAGWYEGSLRSEISQGDVFDGVPFSTPKEPLTHLTKDSAKRHPVVWVPSEGPDNSDLNPKHCLAHYRLGHGMLVSHDCAIDKPNRTTRYLFAPLRPLSELDAAVQNQVRDQAHLAVMYVPEKDNIPESGVDLRLIGPFPRDLVLSLSRSASLTDQGRERLQTALIAFFVHRDRTKDGP